MIRELSWSLEGLEIDLCRKKMTNNFVEKVRELSLFGSVEVILPICPSPFFLINFQSFAKYVRGTHLMVRSTIIKIFGSNAIVVHERSTIKITGSNETILQKVKFQTCSSIAIMNVVK